MDTKADVKFSPEVDSFMLRSTRWKNEFELLRNILSECPLDESLKWGQPCYSLKGKNVVLMHGFKEYCALLFFKGVLMKDEHQLLITQTENVQAGRQMRFSGIEQIIKHQKEIQQYILEAIEIEQSGAKPEFKKTTEYSIPQEFQHALNQNPDLTKAFGALTPGRQRAYLLFFSSPKQSATRESRIHKMIPQIMNGKGLND